MSDNQTKTFTGVVGKISVTKVVMAGTASLRDDFEVLEWTSNMQTVSLSDKGFYAKYKNGSEWQFDWKDAEAKLHIPEYCKDANSIVFSYQRSKSNGDTVTDAKDLKASLDVARRYFEFKNHEDAKSAKDFMKAKKLTVGKVTVSKHGDVKGATQVETEDDSHFQIPRF